MASVSDIESSPLARLAEERWVSGCTARGLQTCALHRSLIPPQCTCLSSSQGDGRFLEQRDPSQYDAALVSRIYHEELMPAVRRGRTSGSLSAAQILELGSYLEYYLWPSSQPTRRSSM
jgi:hypothetical protein